MHASPKYTCANLLDWKPTINQPDITNSVTNRFLGHCMLYIINTVTEYLGLSN